MTASDTCNSDGKRAGHGRGDERAGTELFYSTDLYFILSEKTTFFKSCIMFIIYRNCIEVVMFYFYIIVETFSVLLILIGYIKHIPNKSAPPENEQHDNGKMKIFCNLMTI